MEEIGEGSVDPRGHVFGGDVDAIFSEEFLDPFHGRPDEIFVEFLSRRILIDLFLDQFATDGSVSGEQGFHVPFEQA